MATSLSPAAVNLLQQEFSEVSDTCLVTQTGLSILLSDEAVEDLNRQAEDEQ